MTTPAPEITEESLAVFQRFEALAAAAARVDNVMEGPEVEALVVQMQHHFGVGIFDLLADVLGDADAVDLDQIAADPVRARELLGRALGVDDPHGDTIGMRRPERLVCDDCGASFPYSYRSEISLPPHGCLERQRARKAVAR